ncbi:MAG: GNAT family N-acetyltransferase [Bacteroidetes bacterium]|nr:GNAT family N-acetyltransferase [Bacteroidota bacterium]
MIRKLYDTEKIPYPLLLLADETAEAIDRYIHDCEIYLYEKNDETIAVYAVQKITETSIEIKNIAVDTPFQNQGIGKQLLHHAAQTAAQRGFHWLLIGTADQAAGPLSLYKKAGFTEFKRIENFFIDNYPQPIYENDKQLKDMIVLRKYLK